MSTQSASPGAVTFLNRHEAATVDALADRIIPGTSEDPGAREAGAVVYIDRALAGPYRRLQPLYRAALAALDDECLDQHGQRFVDLKDQQQESILKRLSEGEWAAAIAAERAESGVEQVDLGLLPYFFAVVRQHVVEGTFGDPVYGGNRNGIGWRMIGFPGAQWGYGEEEMTYGFDSSTLPLVTLQDLRDQRGGQQGGS